MPDGMNGPVVNLPLPQQRINASFAQRVGMAIKAARSIVSGINPATWMGPLQPLAPFAPIVEGRQYDYNVGRNINYLPRGYGTGLVTFPELRGLASNCEMLRLVIETRKDQITSMDWQIKSRDEDGNDEDDDIDTIQKFFEKPDQIHGWSEWLRANIEELSVTDAVAILRSKNRGGKPYAFELMDGSTIFPILDETGRRPDPPSPAYQQILKGSPKVNYTSEELLYAPRNVRVYSPYGYSPTEQVIVSCRMDMQRAAYQLAYFTQGSLPDAYAVMPENMTRDDIKAFEERFNDILSGNPSERRKVPFLPFGTTMANLKEPPLKDDFDEWITRKICFAFSIPPNNFIKMMSRATGETQVEQGEEQGLAPIMRWVKNTIDLFIAEDFGRPDLEFAWKDDKELDPAIANTIAKDKVSTAQWTINEARDKDGLDPIEGGDQPMVLTSTGYVPLDAFEQQQQTQQDNFQATLDSNERVASTRTAAGDAAGQGVADGKKPAANKPADKSLGKAVRHQPIPFHRPIVARAEKTLAVKIHAILRSTAKDVAAQIDAQKLAKDDNDDEIDLSGLDVIVDSAPEYLLTVGEDSGQRALVQIGVGNKSDLVNQVNQRALDYAKNRAAEMVGKKWVDDELVDNPNADWVITDATRDELRDIIARVYSGDLDPSDLKQAIMDAGAFSEDRAKLIARTETMAANAQGSLSGYRSAREFGVNVKKAWHPDALACDICLINGDDGAVDLDEYFSSGDSAPPAHPNCECVLVPVVGEDEDGEE